MCPNDDGGRPSKLVLTGDTSAVRPPGIRPAFRGDEAVPTLERSRSRNNFDGVRLLAAIFIVYGHQTVDQSGTFGLRLLMFFSISGFLVTGSWVSDPSALRFLTRRFLRIWPAFAVLIVCCAALSWLFPSPDMPEMSRLASAFYLTNLLFHGFDWGFFPARNPLMNQSLWMLPFEIDLYLAFVLVALLGRKARICCAVSLVLAAVTAHPTTAPTGGLLECWSLYFSGFFAFGVLLKELPRLQGSATAAVSVACGIVALGLGERSAGLLLIIPPAAVWIGQQSWVVLRSAGRFGDLSLGIFLWSAPVQQVTGLWLNPQLPVMLQLAVVLAQVIPIAWFSHRLIEEPALRYRPARPRVITAESR